MLTLSVNLVKGFMSSQLVKSAVCLEFQYEYICTEEVKLKHKPCPEQKVDQGKVLMRNEMG
jgi:hypothetical protein